MPRPPRSPGSSSPRPARSPGGPPCVKPPRGRREGLQARMPVSCMVSCMVAMHARLCAQDGHGAADESELPCGRTHRRVRRGAEAMSAPCADRPLQLPGASCSLPASPPRLPNSRMQMHHSLWPVETTSAGAPWNRGGGGSCCAAVCAPRHAARRPNRATRVDQPRLRDIVRGGKQQTLGLCSKCVCE
jgi:hypothetical protein